MFDMRDFIENPLWNSFLVNAIKQRRFFSKITQNEFRESVIDTLRVGYFPARFFFFPFSCQKQQWDLVRLLC